MARYALSFTSGGLLAREANAVVQVYRSVRDWEATRSLVREKNLLQARTASSSTRMSREVIQRLKMLSESELELMSESSPTEQSHLLWAAACRRYELVGEYAEEVLRERFLLLTPTLDEVGFNRFVMGKSLWRPELDEIKPSTLQRLRQNLFRMIREAGLLTDDDDIVPAVLSERVHRALASQRPSDVRFFPTTLPMEVGQ